MSAQTPSSPLPSLSGMNLRIGQPVQVLWRAVHEYKHYTRLIGFWEPDYVILRMPMENGWPVPLNNKQTLDVRLFSEVSIFQFSTTVQSVQNHPRNFVVLDYPQAVQETRLRSHERVNCQLPVRVTESSIGPSEGYHFLDLSGSGASLVGPHPLGDVRGAITLELAFELKATGTQECLRLSATIQAVQALPVDSAHTTLYRHGIQFQQIDPRVLLLVHELPRKRS